MGFIQRLRVKNRYYRFVGAYVRGCDMGLSTEEAIAYARRLYAPTPEDLQYEKEILERESEKSSHGERLEPGTAKPNTSDFVTLHALGQMLGQMMASQPEALAESHRVASESVTQLQTRLARKEIRLAVSPSLAALYLVDADPERLLSDMAANLAWAVWWTRWSLLIEWSLLGVVAILSIGLSGWAGIIALPALVIAWKWGVQSNRDGHGIISLSIALGFFLALFQAHSRMEIAWALSGMAFGIVQRLRYTLPARAVRVEALNSQRFLNEMIDRGIVVLSKV